MTNGKCSGRSSDENHCLRIRYLEPAAAARIRTEEHVVHAHHIIAGLGEFGAIEFARAARQVLLLAAPQPADFKIRSLAALRANVSCRLGFLAFGVKISFVHSSYSLPQRAFLSHYPQISFITNAKPFNKGSPEICVGPSRTSSCDCGR
jgi:hypothetical protein